MSLLLARRRLRATAASLLLSAATSTFALDTATIVSSALSPDCLEYRVVGICYWLYCTPFGCSVRTSVKVRHYVPDAVVSSYSNTGENPWLEVRAMSMPNPTAKAGGDGTTNHDNENNLAKFKNADVIGHPAGMVFSQFASASGYTCEGAGTAFMPYLLSTLDTMAWRYNIPEAFYPEALIPGRREIGTRMAFGATGTDIARLFLVEGAWRLAAGLAAGALLAAWLTPRLALFLFQVSPRDPSVYAASMLVVAAVGLSACLVPALRAARQDPNACLRDE